MGWRGRWVLVGLLVTLALPVRGWAAGLGLGSQPGEHVLDNDGHWLYVRTKGRPGVLQPFLLLIPPRAPVAVAVLIPGGGGDIGLLPTGDMRNGQNFLIRSRGHFLDAGLAVAIIGLASDRVTFNFFRSSPEHTADLAGVIAYLRRKLGVPVWLVGTSRGTISAAFAAARLALPAGPDGIVLASSVTVHSRGTSVAEADLAAIRVPVLLVQDREDTCQVTPLSGARALLPRLVHAPARALIVINGGGPPEGLPCTALAYHGFVGAEVRTVRAITDWIKAHPPRRGGS